ncbi:MAG: 5-oxoprolinase subunit PxpA [Sinobacteraceae bacterium]|nr:5-oxoprolinase subunit PxpA [Nevskiaceae bacterium]
MNSLRLDLNCDLGESFGTWAMGDDENVLPHVSSANIACGFHAGDPQTMQRSVALCVQHNVAIGAQPGWPDLLGFGRRSLAATAAETYALVLYQIGALAGFAPTAQARLAHVKPHGALYNQAAQDPALAQAIARAVADFDATLILYALAGSELEKAGHAASLAVAREAFADRRYLDDGSLQPRSQPGAVIEDPARACQQALAIVQHQQVTTCSGQTLPLQADTLCIHGDRANAANFAATLRSALVEHGVDIDAPRKSCGHTPPE